MVQVTDDQACAVIDDFLLEPGAAVDYAVARAGEFESQDRGYPGSVLPVANRALGPVNRFIARQLGRLFGFARTDIDFHTQYSLATLQPADFTWIQRLCHQDPRLEAGRRNFATVLYLFDDPELGGTGFYRWRDADYWAEMTAQQRDDPNAGLDELREKYEMFRQPARWMTESNEAAELLDVAPARFNRLIFYSGELPHSAYIEHPERLSADPARGRLTLNTFVSAWPK